MHTGYLFNSYSKDPGPLEKASSKHSQEIVKKSFFLPFHVLLPLTLEGKLVLTKIITLVSIPGNHTLSPLHTFAYVILSACKTSVTLIWNIFWAISMFKLQSPINPQPQAISLYHLLTSFYRLISTKGHAKCWTFTLGLFVGL